ncbi:MAG: type II secretion system protein [Planctomycetota bacterium]
MRQRRAFTLIELLVVIAILALLLGVLLPALRKARFQAQTIVCASNLKSVGVAIYAYANDYEDTIPFGPQAPLPSPSNFYPVTGMVTSLISLQNKAPIGLGLLLEGCLAEQPKALFCPATDQHSDADKQLSYVGKRQAQCDYYYRHASATTVPVPETFRFRLSDPHKNRNGRTNFALAMDVQFLAHPSFKTWGVVTRTAHRQKIVNVLLIDGRVVTTDNKEEQFTVDCMSGSPNPNDAPEKILQAFELADELR